MTILTVTAKNQVTLRKDLMKHLGIKPGDKIAVDPGPDGKATISRVRPKGGIEAFFGSLHRPGEAPRSLEEIDEIIKKGWAGEL